MKTKNTFLLFLIVILIGCNTDTRKETSTPTKPTNSNFRIVKTLPHDPDAFTQGLTVHKGIIIEGTGLNRKSWISTYDPKTLDYKKRVILSDEYFGEGLTILNQKIFQLTYKSRVGLIYDSESFEQIGEFSYAEPIKEGWGITHNGEELIVSDGSSNLYFLDTVSMKILRNINVRSNGNPQSKLNELEYINGYIYANVWESNVILKIAPNTGNVVDTYDLTFIQKMEKSKNASLDVLNGIASDPQTNHLIVTGKYWSNYYYLSMD